MVGSPQRSMGRFSKAFLCAEGFKQRGPCLSACDAVHGKAVVALEGPDGGAGAGAEDAVGAVIAAGIAQMDEIGLERGHVLAGAAPGDGGVVSGAVPIGGVLLPVPVHGGLGELVIGQKLVHSLAPLGQIVLIKLLIQLRLLVRGLGRVIILRLLGGGDGGGGGDAPGEGAAAPPANAQKTASTS